MKRLVGTLSLLVLLLNSVITPLTYAQEYQEANLSTQVNNTVESTPEVGSTSGTDGEQTGEIKDLPQFPVIEENTQAPETSPVEEQEKEPTDQVISPDNDAGTGGGIEEPDEGSGGTASTDAQELQPGAQEQEQTELSGGTVDESIGTGGTQDEPGEEGEEGDEDEDGILSVAISAIEDFLSTIRYFFVKDKNEFIRESKIDGIKVITLENPENGETITMMDRNLGAEDNDISSEDSYGYYYQRGNNNGFEEVNEGNISAILAIYSGKYEGIGYTRDDKFRVGSNDIWETDEEGKSSYDELWYLGEDEEIQGPCPEGYHIPSIKEWNKVVTIWTKIHTQDEKDGKPITRSTKSDNIKSSLEQCGTGDFENQENCMTEEELPEISNIFMEELKLPKAGRYNGAVKEDSIGVYWTRTPGNKSYQSEIFSIEKYLGETFDDTNYKNRSNANSLRCFKNENDFLDIDMLEDLSLYDGGYTITFDSMGGSYVSPVSGVQPTDDLETYRPKTDPYKVGYMFLGWFDNLENATRYKFQGTTITGDLTLYAKWAPFNDITYTGIVDGVTYSVTLMDRNMGATATGAMNNATVDSYGFYYHWGNNYGFYYDKPNKNINNRYTDENLRPDTSLNGPSNWAYEERLFYTLNANGKNDWAKKSYNNLWGGDGDASGNNYDNGHKKYTRQGPCPKGYHVPSIGERHKLLRLFMNNEYPSHSVTTKLNDNTWKNNIGKGNANYDYTVTEEIRDKIGNTFYLPYAGRFQKTYDWNRQVGETNKDGSRAPYWASSTKTSEKALGFELKQKTTMFSLGVWEDERVQGKAVRCFKDQDDYTIVWKNLDDSSLSQSGYVIEADYYVNEGEHPHYDGTTPDKVGEKFIGWYDSIDENQTLITNEDFDTITISSNKIYIAKFIPAFYVDVEIIPPTGGTVVGKGGYEEGETVTLTATQNIGYQFSGWFDESDNFITDDNPYVFTADSSDGTGLKAIFEPNEYIIITGTNDENMGTISYEGEPIHGNKITFTTHRSIGYVLDRWEVNGDTYLSGSVVWTGDDLEIEMAGDLTVTGHFSAEIHKITYHDTNNVEADVSFTGVHNQPTTNVEVPTWSKEGYTLTWSDETPSTYPAEDTVINSVWTANTYKVHFDGNGAISGSMTDQDFTYDEGLKSLTANGFENTGRLFKGRATSPDGAKVYSDQEFVQNLTSQSGVVINLYAKWGERCSEYEEEGPDEHCHISANGQRALQIVSDLDMYLLVSDGSPYNKHATIMDRNMGATDRYDGNYSNPNEGSKGYLYQWGNNYGFPSTGTLEEHNVFTTGNQTEKIDWEKGIPSKYSSMIYYLNSAKDSNWMKDSSTSDGIWGGTGDAIDSMGPTTTSEGRQGPCPTSYHVPSNVEYNNLYELYKIIRSDKRDDFSQDFLIPPVGRRAGDGILGETGQISYWSSSPHPTDKTKALGVWRSDTAMTIGNEDGRARARSVRCVKNVANTSATTIDINDIHLNGGTKVFISIDSGVILTLGNPTLTSAQSAVANFGGWYTTPNFSGNALTTGMSIEAGSSLYAKYTCKNTAKIWDGTDCVDGLILSFDTDGGTQVESQVIEPGNKGTRPTINPTKTGSVFDNWYTSKNGDELFDFDEIITESVTAFAHWIPNIYTVTVLSNDETKGTISIIAEGQYTHGKRIEFSPTYNSSMYKFVKWSLNGGDVYTGNNQYLTGNLVIEELTGDVTVMGYFTGYNSCTFNNQTIQHGGTVTGYQSSTVPFGQSCVSETRTCNDGSLDGSYEYASCTVLPAASCDLPWGGTIQHGESITGYQSSTVPFGQTCESQLRTCYNGTLDGSYEYVSCTVQPPQSCKLPWSDEEVPHDSIVTGYSTTSETCPNQCNLEAATCNNGTWSIANFNTYNQSCTTNANDTSGYPLNACPTNGNCSSITKYEVSDNACVQPTEKYKLDSCVDGWHIENNSCVNNTQQTPCTPRIGAQLPDNSHNVEGIVNITWNEGWPEAPKCDWACDEHYHTGNNGESCDIDTFTITWIDGNGSTLKTDTLAYGATPSYVGDTPTKTRTAQYTYTFNDTWLPEIVDVVGDATYTAQFDEAVNNYTITFHSNSGSNVPQQTKPYGSTGDKPTDPTRIGYEFEKWYSDSGFNQEYTFSETIEGNVDLYAKWTPINYTIAYYGILPGEASNPLNYTIETDTFTLNNPEREGYTFLGWTGSNNESTPETEVTITSGSYGNKFYYANWQAQNVTVKINHHLQDLNAETNEILSTHTLSGSTTTQELADSTITLSNYTQTIEGYSYSGGEVNGESTITTTVAPDGSREIDLYYTRNYYLLMITSDAGANITGTSPIGEYYYGAEITLSGEESSDCYIWSGWDVQGTTLINNINNTSFHMPANAVTVNASVTEKTYNVVFVGNGNDSGGMEVLNGVKCTESRALPANAFEKNGYTFSGWTTTVNGEKEYEDGDTIQTLTTGNNATVSLIAVWDINYYPVVFKNYDGEVLDSQSVPFGTTPEYKGLTTPSRDADEQYTYSFSGWTPEFTEVEGPQVYTATFSTTLNEYTITWNVDGTLTSQTYQYGQTPNPEGINIAKDPTQQYEYSFNGWSPSISKVTGDATYTAQYTETLRKYTVKWTDHNGTVLETDENVPYGTVPTYNGATPAREGDAQHTYIFTGWNDGTNTYGKDEILPGVSGNVTYSAVFVGNTNKYSVTWKNEDGTILEYDENVPYGSMPSYDSETPYKTGNQEYEYVFAGWSPATGEVTKDVVYAATYTPVLKKYTVTWRNSDNSVIKVDTGVEYGTTPEYIGDTPTSGGDAEYSYEFTGWNPVVGEIHGDTTYTAVYTHKKNKYTITRANRDGTVLETVENVEYGTTPTHGDITPIRTGDAHYSYNFIGWEPEISAVTGDTTYIAQFEQEEKSYNVTFENDDGSTLLEPRLYVYGTTWDQIVKPTNTPTKAEDNQYTYTFSGWTPSILEVTGDVTFKATYNTTLKTYTITWNNYDGTLLKTDENVPYGTTPSYSGETPTKPGTAQYSYVFIGWDPEISTVQGDKTYTAQFTGVTEVYTVTWHNEDGTELEVDHNVVYGTMPEYNGETPTKTGNMEYRYIFDGWTPEISAVTATITYTAKFRAETKTYTVTWKNDDGTVLETDENVPYGRVPNYGGETPFKTGNVQYSYVFNKWTPEVTTVAGNMEYTATYTEVINKYEVIWKNEDGTVLQSGEVEYGSTPTYSGGTPTKEGDTQYSYEFSGWDAEISEIHGNTIYTAIFTQSINKYLITWLDGNGTEIQSSEVEYGQTPTYTGDTPTKTRTAQHTYTFNNTWSPEVVPVVGEATYTAQFNETINEYTITWKDGNGETLKTDTLAYGATPAYTGDTPTKARTDQYTYEFNNTWSPTIEEVTGNATYTAQFNETVNEYTITWKDGNGATLKTEQVAYGATPAYTGDTPTKARTDQYTYEFNNTWSPTIEEVTGNATYTAQFNETVNEYTITWKDGNGATLKTEQVAYGETPAYDGDTPTKTRTDQFTYTFNNTWSPAIVPVVGEATYTAQFTSTVNKYTITWNNRDGTLLKSEDLDYGVNPVYGLATPTSGGDAQYMYTFERWTPGVSSVVGDAIYTAVYTQTTNKYTITFLNDDDSLIEEKEVAYGTISSDYKPTDPTKIGYTFAGWFPNLKTVEGNQTYKATYTINQYTITPQLGNGMASIEGGGVYDYAAVIVLTGTAKEGYHFEGGETVKAFTITVGANNETVIINAIPNTYTIRFQPGEGEGTMADQEFTYDLTGELRSNSFRRNGFTFTGWMDEDGVTYPNKGKIFNLATGGILTFTALWVTGETQEEPETSTSQASAGGGRVINHDSENEHGSAENQTGDTQQGDDKQRDPSSGISTGSTSGTGTDSKGRRSEDELTVYQWAYKYSITTLAPEEAAQPDGYVVRGHMAKMVVNYAVNVLGWELPEKLPKHCKWKDGKNAWESQEIKDFSEKACALGLMGIDMEYFQPYKLVTRAQFGTILGRMLWGKMPAKPYYAAHLNRLNAEGIMKKIDNPEEQIEIRKWAWLMLMRSEKYFEENEK